MENSQPLTADQIIARIASDRALQDVLQPLLEEVQQLRNELGQMRDVLAGAAAPKYLTIPEVAEMFGICAETVRRRVRSGEWPAAKIGKQTRFGPEEITVIRELSAVPLSAPVTTWERRARNRKLRSIPIFHHG